MPKNNSKQLNAIPMNSISFKRSGSILIFLFTSLLINSQITIGGKIIDSNTKESLIGAAIQIKGSYIGSYSDSNGSFSLTTEEELPLVIVVSYLGYNKQEIELTEESSSLNVLMEEQIFLSNEIVVEAQLREQVLQEVPMSVAAFDENFVNRSGELDDPGDLIPYVPGFSGMNYSSSGSTYTIRGVNSNALGLGAESKVAIFHDGAYNGRAPSAARGFFDVERVEVLKGPQGTLFGRNATAGAINIYSNSPKFYKDLSVELMGGNWGQMGLNLMANIPVSNKVAVRYAGKIKKRDGLLTVVNQDDHQLSKGDVIANRLSFLIRPSNTFNATLKLEQQRTEGGGIAVISTNTDFGGASNPFERKVNLDTRPMNDNTYLTGSLKLNWVLNDNIALNSITAVNKNEQEFLGDFDGLPTNILRIGNPNEFTNYIQEIRLSGKSEKLDWLVAGSIFGEDASSDTDFMSSDAFMIPFYFGFTDPSFFTFCDGNPACGDFSELAMDDINSTSIAFYGDLTYAISDKINATVGIRYTKDNKEYETSMELGNGTFHTLGFFNISGPTGSATFEDSWSGVQPRITLDYHVNPDVMFYGSYNKGYLAGGINTLTVKPFEEETNDAFEIGIKSSLFNNRLKFNLAGYQINYENLQVEVLRVGINEIENAARVKSRGLEFETALNVTEGFDLITNLAINDSKYEEYIIPDPFIPGVFQDFSGNIPDRSPQTQLSIIGQYTKEISEIGNLFIRGDYSYQSKQYFDRSNDEEIAQEGFGLINGSIGIEGLANNKLSVSIFANNLADQNFSVLSTRSFDGGYTIVPGLPRLVGVKLRFYNLL